MMNRYRKPMYRSIMIGSIIFIILLGVSLSALTYVFYTKSIYKKYEEELTSIIHLIESHIDKDDLYYCSNSLEETEKYKELQDYMDNFIDYYTNIHYLYILKPLNTNPEDNVMSVCSANSAYEKEHSPESVLHLGDTVGDAYSPELAQKFFDIMEKEKDVVFFEEDTAWSIDYTGALALRNSNGTAFAVLCADQSIDTMHSAIRQNILIEILFIASLGLIYIVIFLTWMHYNITKPIHSLESSVYDFAEKSKYRNDPSDLVYKEPNIHTDNEVESLSRAINAMSHDIHNYVVSLVEAEENIRILDNIARQDNLTGVGNKYAYSLMEVGLNHDIAENKDITRFALMVIDINFLKRVNDTYGHNRGNEYIAGTCELLSAMLGKENIYRIGGDEFVILLSGEQYYKRFDLEDSLLKVFDKTEKDNRVNPWRRFSASLGLASYEPDVDIDVDSVFKRADKIMYKRKQDSRKGRV